MLTALAAVFFLSGCKNDIELNADWKEIVVVYGLLNANDTAQYIRIQKAFQNKNGTAVSFAQNPDSLYYDTLKVKLINLNTSAESFLTKDNSLPKDTGYFQSGENILYKYKGPLNPMNRYKLVIENPKTGFVVTGETQIVDKATITNPINDSMDIGPNRSLLVRFNTGRNAFTYDAVIRLNYEEYDINTNALKNKKFVDYYVMRSYQTPDLLGGKRLEQSTLINDLYTFWGNSIPVDAGLYRKATTLDIRVSGAAEDLQTYIDVSRPSIGIVQKKPEYTNLINGYGIFSSRNFVIQAMPLNLSSKLSIIANPATAKLNFRL